jgi:hypothetical protein
VSKKLITRFGSYYPVITNQVPDRFSSYPELVGARLQFPSRL